MAGGVAFLWFAAGLRAAQANPDLLVAAFVSAWNNHDAKAFGELFSERADWVTASGARLKGRAAVEAFLAKEHLSWARTTTMAASDIEVNPLGQDLVLVLFRWKIVGGALADGSPAPTYEGNTLLVGRQQESRWTIVAGQVSNRTTVR